MFQALQGQAAIVTGGASGIGEATCRLLAEHGVRVVIADIDSARGKQLAQEIDGLFVQADVSQSSSVDALIQSCKETYGGVDFLVNNAFRSDNGLLAQLSDEQWHKTLNVTLDGVFYGCRAALGVMKPGSAIVNIASISGLGGDYGLGAYNTAKAGVINLTRTLALESGSRGIRVNAICPGLINTPPLQRVWQTMSQTKEPAIKSIPLKRLGEPEDIARAICFLLSDYASYVHGSTLVVDGGLTTSSGIIPLVSD